MQMAPVSQMGMMPGMVAAPAAPAAVPAVPAVEWAIHPGTQQKYTALFHQTDKARTGFLAGVQARNILLQSGLPQNILAQIWFVFFNNSENVKITLIFLSVYLQGLV